MLEEGVTAFEDVPYETWLREKLSEEKRRIENSVSSIYDDLPSSHNSGRIYRSVSTVNVHILVYAKKNKTTPAVGINLEPYLLLSIMKQMLISFCGTKVSNTCCGRLEVEFFVSFADPQQSMLCQALFRN